jgi:hypothetical protein
MILITMDITQLLVEKIIMGKVILDINFKKKILLTLEQDIKILREKTKFMNYIKVELEKAEFQRFEKEKLEVVL